MLRIKAINYFKGLDLMMRRIQILHIVKTLMIVQTNKPSFGKIIDWDSEQLSCRETPAQAFAYKGIQLLLVKAKEKGMYKTTQKAQKMIRYHFFVFWKVSIFKVTKQNINMDKAVKYCYNK